MFVEDFIIDAYNIQLREEVGDVAFVFFYFSFDTGCACVLALLFDLNRKQGGSEWVPAVLQGRLPPLLCCHVLQPWPGRAHQAKKPDRNLQEPLWGGRHSRALPPPPSWIPACPASYHLATPCVCFLCPGICCLLSQGGGRRGRGSFVEEKKMIIVPLQGGSGGQCRLVWGSDL